MFKSPDVFIVALPSTLTLLPFIKVSLFEERAKFPPDQYLILYFWFHQ